MLYFIIAALIIALDQTTKYFITLQLSDGGQIDLIPGVIHLTYAENVGAAFSFLSNMRWPLAAITAAVIVVAIVLIIRHRASINRLGMLALTAVLGGAMSHLIDRVVIGYVVDFFELEFVTFAVFDVADCFITVGGIVFCVYYLLRRDDLNKEPFRGRSSKKKNEDTLNTDEASSTAQPEDNSGTD